MIDIPAARLTTQTRRRISPLAHRPYRWYERCTIELTALVWIAPADARLPIKHQAGPVQSGHLAVGLALL